MEELAQTVRLCYDDRLVFDRFRKKAGISRSSVFITRWNSSWGRAAGEPELACEVGREGVFGYCELLLEVGRSEDEPAGRARTPAA